jgi:hypothetical protein
MEQKNDTTTITCITDVNSTVGATYDHKSDELEYCPIRDNIIVTFQADNKWPNIKEVRLYLSKLIKDQQVPDCLKLVLLVYANNQIPDITNIEPRAFLNPDLLHNDTCIILITNAIRYKVYDNWIINRLKDMKQNMIYTFLYEAIESNCTYLFSILLQYLTDLNDMLTSEKEKNKNIFDQMLYSGMNHTNIKEFLDTVDRIVMQNAGETGTLQIYRRQVFHFLFKLCVHYTDVETLKLVLDMKISSYQYVLVVFFNMIKESKGEDLQKPHNYLYLTIFKYLSKCYSTVMHAKLQDLFICACGNPQLVVMCYGILSDPKLDAIVIPENNQNKALVMAISEDNIHIVQLLLSHQNINPHTLSHTGKTMLQLCIAYCAHQSFLSILHYAGIYGPTDPTVNDSIAMFESINHKYRVYTEKQSDEDDMFLIEILDHPNIDASIQNNRLLRSVTKPESPDFDIQRATIIIQNSKTVDPAYDNNYIIKCALNAYKPDKDTVLTLINVLLDDPRVNPVLDIKLYYKAIQLFSWSYFDCIESLCGSGAPLQRDDKTYTERITMLQERAKQISSTLCRYSQHPKLVKEYKEHDGSMILRAEIKQIVHDNYPFIYRQLIEFLSLQLSVMHYIKPLPQTFATVVTNTTDLDTVYNTIFSKKNNI